ncbi:MAG: MotA/TolQ/ExbB proton channel family protein, partial [Gammaproteobacteria bacterium]
GGSLLAALVDSPDWMERWHQGGWIGYLISAVGVLALLLALWRLLVLSGVSRRVNVQLTSDSPSEDNPLGRVLKVGMDNRSMDAESLELKLHEQVLKERPAIESGLNLLKIIAMVAPLMGLLGTVTGMIVTFQSITLFGTGDPKTMAGGISAALVTTVLGLCVAIPTVLLHTFVNGRAQRVLHILEEQSAGIVAEQAESR